MNTLTARPRVLKQANLSLIRKAIKTRGTATRAEIAGDTKISSTTVRSLLAEMLENGEIQSIGHDESSGGRKAERYCFQPERYHGAAFCISDQQIHVLLVNVCGEIVETVSLEVNGDFQQVILDFLDELVLKKEIKSIGFGVPGIVEGGSFQRKNPITNEFETIAIGDSLSKRYGIPVILENDLNATAIGFGRCYEQQFPQEKSEDTNMAYLHFESSCVSAGFIVGGRVVRGSHNFAGELGLVPLDNNRLLHEWISQPMDDLSYTNTVIQVIGWVCGILNPQYVVLGGPCFRRSCLGPIADGLSALLPKHMFAEILYSPDVWHDYYEGMAYLTAGRMFDEVQLIKE